MSQKIEMLEKNHKSQDALEDRLEKVEEIAELNPKDECNCNLVDIENDILELRHLVVSNDVRISQNLNLLSTNRDQINDLQTSMANVESFPPPGRIIFSAYKDGGIGYFSGDVTYTTLVENVGNGLDTRTGVFSCPQAGLYMFSFSGTTRNQEIATYVRIYINGVEDLVLYSQSDDDNRDCISHTWLSHLNINDKVNIKVTHGLLNAGRRISFNGIKLK